MFFRGTHYTQYMETITVLMCNFDYLASVRPPGARYGHQPLALRCTTQANPLSASKLSVTF